MTDPPTHVAPMLVCLSGSLKGCTFTPSGSRITLGTDGANTVRFPPSLKRPVEPTHAEIVRGDTGWTIRNLAEVPLIVNDASVGEADLEQNDLIRLGPEGPLLRFRLTSGGEKTKSFKQLLLDSTTMVNESKGSKTTFLRAAALAQRLASETVHHGSTRMRIGVGAALVGIVALASWMVYRQMQIDEREQALDEKISSINQRGDALDRDRERLEDKLAAEAKERERLARQLEKERAQRAALATALGKLDDKRREQSRTLRALIDRTEAVDSAVSHLTDELEAAKRIHEDYAPGVAVIVVGVTFHKRGDVKTVVRHKVDQTSPELRKTGGVMVGGQGPIYVEWVTGSGFVIDDEGTLVTNRHVVQPWWESPGFGRGLLDAGFEPRRAHLFACFPGNPEPIALDAVRNSADADVALVRCTNVPSGLPALSIPTQDPPASAGDKVILLGYPEGVQGLVNKLDAESVKQLESVDVDDLGAVVRKIAELGGIRATLTQGVLSDVTKQYLVYDAVSTRGGSGGPLFSTDGHVLGINTAVSEAFAGHNYALRLAPARAVIAR